VTLPRTAARVPASRRQATLWRLEQRLGGNPLLNRSLAYRLSGRLDPDALRRAVDDLVARHRVLATTFVEDGDQVVGVLGAAPRLEVHEVDDAAAVDELVARERLRPFGTGEEPLFRAVLVTVDGLPVALLFVLHLIVCDRRSLEILVREVGALYTANGSESPAQLPPIPIQYSELAEREAARTRERKADEAYWLDRLAGLAPVVLPADLLGSAGEAVATGTARAALGPELRRASDAFGRERRSTVFVTLAAALAAVVHGYTGDGDFSVGTALENRRSVEAERLIGPFSGGILLRFRVSDGDTFGELTSRLHRALLEGMHHQTLPFDELVAALERTGGTRTALAGLSLDVREPRPELRLAGVETHRIETPPGEVEASVGAGFHLDVRRTTDDLLCEASYDASRFSPGRVDELLERLATLLSAAVEAPDVPLGRLRSQVAPA
jgi:hypothetical protein